MARRKHSLSPFVPMLQGRKWQSRECAGHWLFATDFGDSGFAETFDQALLDLLHHAGNATMKCMFNRTLWGNFFTAGRDQAFVQRKIHIRQCDTIGITGQAPATCVTLLRSQKACFTKPTQNPANHHRVCPGMVGNIRRCSHTSRVPRHVAEGMKGKGQAAIALHVRLFAKWMAYVTIAVAFV